MWWAVMRVSASSGVSILMTPILSRIEYVVERTSAEELSENVFRVTEHEWESAENEIALEWIVLMSSTVVISVVSFVVS